MQTGPVLTFDHYTVDLPNAQLWRGKRAIPLASQTFAVLRYLVDHAGQVVSKAELFDSLWPGTAVSDGALTFCTVELRKALGDNAKQPKFIETVHRRGYRFIEKVVSSQHSVVSSKDNEHRAGSTEQGAKRGFELPTPSTQHPAPVLVGREAELAQLHQRLEKALNGERQITFVTGEPGIGKTTLLNAFLYPLAPTIRVAQGQCIEHYGPGEPYMPILEALGRLCRTSDGQQVVPLIQRYAPTWLVQMPSLLTAVELKTLQRQTQGATRERMLREMGEAIEAITAERPLVVVLEDLHWSDTSTVELLSVLARRRETARLLVIGTYRPVDVIVQAHSLRAVKQELELHELCRELPLGLLSETHVVEYLAQRFGGESADHFSLQSVARLIHHRTDGNPLFMVTVVDDLVSQGVLDAQANQGLLPEDASGVAIRVPETVQQLIEQQLTRLNAEERRILEVASVSGSEFSAAAIAAGSEMSLEQVEDYCTGLAHQARFLRTNGAAAWPDGTVAAQFSFLHALYQEVLYARIPVGRRQRLHLRLGERLATVYGKRTREIAAELAVHFEQGRDYSKAVYYLHKAGENALQRSAYQEATTLLTKGLELLTFVPDSPERIRQELRLLIALSIPLIASKGYIAPEVEQTCRRAYELSQQLDETPQLSSVIGRLQSLYLHRAELTTARVLAEQLLRLASTAGDSRLLLWAHYGLGFTSARQGEFVAARTHMEQSLALYDPQRHHLSDFVQDPRVTGLALLAHVLYLLGYPDQALQRGQEALAFARQLSHPYSLACVLESVDWLYRRRGETRAAQAIVEEMLALAEEQNFSAMLSTQSVYRGWDMVEQSQGEQGIARMRQGLAVLQTTYFGRLGCLWMLAEAYGRVGQPEEGLKVLARIIHENAGRNGSPLLRSEAITTFGPVVKERADGRVYCTTEVRLPSICPDYGRL